MVFLQVAYGRDRIFKSKHDLRLTRVKTASDFVFIQCRSLLTCREIINNVRPQTFWTYIERQGEGGQIMREPLWSKWFEPRSINWWLHAKCDRLGSDWRFDGLSGGHSPLRPSKRHSLTPTVFSQDYSNLDDYNGLIKSICKVIMQYVLLSGARTHVLRILDIRRLSLIYINIISLIESCSYSSVHNASLNMELCRGNVSAVLFKWIHRLNTNQNISRMPLHLACTR